MKLPYRLLAVSTAALLWLVATPRPARADFVFTLSQVGGDVVASGTGTINLASLTFVINNPFTAEVIPNSAVLFAGASATAALYSAPGLTGPPAFGSGTGTVASSGTGDFAGIYFNFPGVVVPQGYVSGTLLTDTATFAGQTFSSVGVTPGTYTYTWGTGVNADSLTVIAAVPEPASWVSFITGGVVALGLTLRRGRG